LQIPDYFGFGALPDVIKPTLAPLFFELCYLKTMLVAQILYYGDEEMSMQHGLQGTGRGTLMYADAVSFFPPLCIPHGLA